MSGPLRELTRSVHDFLCAYYHMHDVPDPLPFLMTSDAHLASGGQVLVLEAEDGLEIGIQFGLELEQSLGGQQPGPHALGVVTEEVSHFAAIMQAASIGTSLSHLDLEVLGEIDRFLILLHADHVLAHAGYGMTTQEHTPSLSLSSLCALQFERRDFQCSPAMTSTYIKAESIALSHLKRAFQHRWHDTVVDARVCDHQARAYLRDLRQAVTTGGRSVRIFLECA